MNNQLYVDEPCVVSFFFGEFGHFLQFYQAWLRYLKQEKYPNHKFLIFSDIRYFYFIDDFVTYNVDLPQWLYDLNLDVDCSERVLPGSPPGSLTPPNIYAKMIQYMREYYNKDKAVEIWPPRGFNEWIGRKPQVFITYKYDMEVRKDKPIISVFPRRRVRAPQRNVPEFVWKETVDRLKEDFIVVLGGTPSGSCLADYPDDKDVINLIKYNGEDKLQKIIGYLNNSVCSISSQSGLTHVSLLSNCCSHIIGHERDRHCVELNRTGIPSSFRYVADYRCIDSDTILQDTAIFLEALTKQGFISAKKIVNRPSLQTIAEKNAIVGVEIGVDDGTNALNILQNMDIKKLYLIDPYVGYEDLDFPSGTEVQEKIAKEKLKDYESKIVWIKEPSQLSADLVVDELDFVYIDGNHEYPFVKKDIELYYPKIKNDGIIAGHDFNYLDVQRAVREKLFGKAVSYNKCEGSDSIDWWMRKGLCLRTSLKSLIGKKDLVGVEIGVFIGENSFSILRDLDIKKLYLIDPYLDYNGNGATGDKVVDVIREKAHILLQDYSDKIVWVEKLSESAVSDIKETLDFIYIDGNHEYEYVKKDLELYFPLLAENGIIAGHDYENADVIKAVTEFAEENKFTIYSGGDVNDSRSSEWWCINGQSDEEILRHSSYILANLIQNRGK